MPKQWKGFLCVVGAAFLWALAGNVAKYLFNQRVNPVDLAQVRLFLSFLTLALYLAFFRRSLLKVARKHYLSLTIFGVFGVTAVQITYLVAISQTNVATAIFLQYLAPVLVMCYGLFGKVEKLTAMNTLALFCSVLGGFLMVKGAPGGGLAVSPGGLLAGLFSALALAFYTVYSKKWLAVYSSWTLLLWGFGTGSALFCLYRLPWVTFFSYGPQEWLFFLYIAIFSSVIPFGLYIKGLGYLSAVKANLTSTLEPMLASLLAYLLLAETLTAWQLAGGALILGGVILIQLAGAPKVDPAGAAVKLKS